MKQISVFLLLFMGAISLSFSQDVKNEATTNLIDHCESGDCNNGIGVYIWATGGRYEGSFKNGLMDGKGTKIWANGDKYTGEFKNNVRDGIGTYIWKSGVRYTGQYKAGKQEGLGTLVWLTGNYYFGAFANDEQNGYGIHCTPAGAIIYAGQWKDGKKIE